MSVSLEERISSKIPLIIFLAAIGMGLISFTVLYFVDNYSLNYYGDAVSHLFSARRLVDSVEPGINQIGTVWLPLPHLMFLPFSLVDQLYVSGIAGMIVNLPCHAIASVLIYKIIRKQVGLTYVAMIGGFLYASNPNLIYLGITAMTEAPFLLFFIAFVYYFQKWNDGFSEFKNNLKHLALASFFISLATLCRYDAWIVSLFYVLYVIVFVTIKWNNIPKLKFAMILISLIAFSGILLWLILNQYYYDDPFEFANAEFYSASSQAVERPYRDFLYLQPLNDITIYGMAATMISGPILLSMAVMGFVFHLKDENRNKRAKLYGFLSLPPLLTLISLYIGIGEMSQWWFNARFATFLSPLVIILASFAFAKLVPKIKQSRSVILVVIISLFAFQLLTPAFGTVTFIDAESGWVYKQTPDAIKAGEFLRSEYDGGKVMIMTGSSQAHRIMQTSGIHLIQFDEMIEAYLHKPAFKEPWLYDKWIVIGLEPDSDSITAVDYWQQRMNELEEHYILAFENKYYKIFLLKN